MIAYASRDDDRDQGGVGRVPRRPAFCSYQYVKRVEAWFARYCVISRISLVRWSGQA